MKPSKKIEDSWLVAQYCNGHQKAMAVLVKRWHLRFCKQAYTYTYDVDIAKDIAQDTWVTILKNIHCIEQPDKFGAWGLTIVTKKSIDWYRKSKRVQEKQQEILSEKETFNIEEMDVSGNQLEKEKLKRAIALLSEQQQSVLTLFYVESYGITEISEILRISKGTVKSRLFYAREKLKTIRK
ncbi:RNA polymerase sigma factor [uncultured Dokdonia sp.]|uniref:RNA polymerase sigma factor n=1 Tax=uncultured Dokdonia sp. TaxID=575653 RepID=UPI002612F916|nr:RNA polymerase sigma factor [uncultured Dokdonia sp.]